jgi:hypothetical protein
MSEQRMPCKRGCVHTAVMVHAIDDDARVFYERFGFVQSVVAPDTLFYKI